MIFQQWIGRKTVYFEEHLRISTYVIRSFERNSWRVISCHNVVSIFLCIFFCLKVKDLIIVLRPSLTTDQITNHEDNEYLHAEKLGKDGAPCDRVFNECKMSILDQFTGIYTTKPNALFT